MSSTFGKCIVTLSLKCRESASGSERITIQFEAITTMYSTKATSILDIESTESPLRKRGLDTIANNYSNHPSGYSEIFSQEIAQKKRTVVLK